MNAGDGILQASFPKTGQRGLLHGRGHLAARAGRKDVDSGAVILTGEALKRSNARAIAELFASDVGKFVCASAGHHLEAVLAANGSGTVARSRRDKQTLLNVDIGGGTTKFALVREGTILATAAVAVGARLLVKDADRRLVRIEGPAQQVAQRLGIRLALGELLSLEDEARIVEGWRDVLVALIERRPIDGLAAELMLTDPLPAEIVPEAVTLSGGVSEYIFFREQHDFGDLGIPLARVLRQALSLGAISLPALIEPNLGIRATAIGASLFTVQAGSNVYVTREGLLPLRNVPVLVPRLDLSAEISAEGVAQAVRDALLRADLQEGEQPLALAFAWGEPPPDARVRTIAEGIRQALPETMAQRLPLVLLADQGLGRSLGMLLKENLNPQGDVVAMDGLRVSEFDFIDVDRLVHPSDIVPVAIKSLLFAGGLDRSSVRQALLAAVRSGA